MSGLFGDGSPAATQTDPRDQALIAAYERTGRTLDDLPYTDDFERLYQAVGGEAGGTRQAVFHRLHNIRKAARLPKLGRAPGKPPLITAEEESLLAALVVERVGTLGQRDQLLYDSKFDELVQVFNARTGRSLSLHDTWRLVAKLAK